MYTAALLTVYEFARFESKSNQATRSTHRVCQAWTPSSRMPQQIPLLSGGDSNPTDAIPPVRSRDPGPQLRVVQWLRLPVLYQ
jgi:hypothetical protein